MSILASRAVAETTQASPRNYPGSCSQREPNGYANAYAERFVRSIREECLDRLILFGERRQLHVLKEFVVHYHEERNHQGLANNLIAPAPRATDRAGIRCRDRLGGLLRYYYQAA